MLRQPLWRTGVLIAASAALLATAAVPAEALEPADVPAIGVDIGRFHLPISCAISLPDLGGAKVFDLGTSVDVQGVVATSLGPGQQFYLSQGSGAITFPTWLTGLAGTVGIDRADATVSQLSIGATNATPPSINVTEAPQTIKDIVIKPGEPLSVGLPLQGTFDVGPYTAPQSGTVTLKFEQAVAHVTLKASWGFQLKVDATCKPTGGNALLTIAVGGPPGQPVSLIHGAPLNFPAVAPGYLNGIINAPYRCSFGGEQLDAGIAVGGTIPLTVPRSGSMSFTGASGALTIPKATVNKLLDKGFSGSFAGRVTELNLVVRGGTPAVQNVAANLGIPPTPLVRDKDIVLPLPSTGTLSAGPFRPDAGASSVAVSLGSAAATITFNGNAGELPITCGAPSPEVYLVENPVT
ncbi:hypothetical protein Q5425_31780 [Amycolatopsis sp. A133]|uniref:hypothetical protein n=1 Tax=Amycolatopsis sp. A133 TaxID=3064472 RepID=UPI0027E5FAD3|nr:hypothetical protein [Amycolatopsis sp. A133]MDQ7808338.1 hypothetical protein [Amycolatopsis sp. A133]